MLKQAALYGMVLIAFASAARADLSISSKPTKNVICSYGVFTATARGANLSTTELTALLAMGDATGRPHGAGDVGGLVGNGAALENVTMFKA